MGGGEGDGSQGQVKRRRLKKKVLYTYISGGSKRPKRVMSEHVSRVQTGVDDSHRQMLVGPESHLVKCNRVEEKTVARQGEVDAAASQGKISGGQLKRKRVKKDHAFRRIKIDRFQELKVAKIALKFYEKSQGGGDFEIVEVLYKKHARLRLPEHMRIETCCHVTFIAKPKNSDCPKYFFGELLKGDGSSNYEAKYCCTFEPSKDPGFAHGCIFCSPIHRCHPADGYRVGRLPWYIVPRPGWI